MTCRICGGLTTEALATREMMFGLRTEHRYEECQECGSLQIAAIPEDLHRYYDQRAYYSLQDEGEEDGRDVLRAWIGNRLDRAQIFSERGFFGRLARRRASLVAERLKSYIGESPVRSFQARILDVGCGWGALVRELAMHGFRRAEGIDPFMSHESEQTAKPPRLRRASLSDIAGEEFDLVLLTHVMEHVENPSETMKGIASVLAPRGVCRIEVPVADSEARREYGGDWVELDPPRHLNIPTRAAMQRLAAEAALEIYRREPVGTGFEFWGSEMYRRGLTLFDGDRGRYREASDVFSEVERRAFDERAAAAAARGESGRERFYLRR